MPDIDKVIDLSACPLGDEGFITACRDQLDRDGVVTIPGFLREAARKALVAEAEAESPNAFFTSSTHNVYLTPPRPELGAAHVFNRQIYSSKGCINRSRWRARCSASRPLPSSIWQRQEVPSATIAVSASAARTAGKSEASAMRIDTS